MAFSVVIIQGNILQEKFEDIKGVVRSRASKKDRQYNGQMKKDKRTNNNLQNIHKKLKIEYPTKNRGWTKLFWKGKQVLLH